MENDACSDQSEKLPWNYRNFLLLKYCVGPKNFAGSCFSSGQLERSMCLGVGRRIAVFKSSSSQEIMAVKLHSPVTYHYTAH